MAYGAGQDREKTYGQTTVINTSDRYTLQIPDREVPMNKWNQVIWMGKDPYRSGLEGD